MGRRGCAPTPTPILKLRGCWKAKLRKKEPKVELVAPKCPASLTAEEKAVWKHTVPVLLDMGVLAKIDETALEIFCQDLVRRRHAQDFIAKHGETYTLTETGEDGEKRIRCIVQFPQVSIARSLGDSLRRMMVEFGMTPSARTRIEVESRLKTPADDLSDFVKSKHA